MDVDIVSDLLLHRFFRILVEDSRVNRFWFNIGLVCLGIDVVIFIYISYILPCFTPKVLGKDLDWNISSPRAIPIATGLGVLMGFSFIFGFMACVRTVNTIYYRH